MSLGVFPFLQVIISLLLALACVVHVVTLFVILKTFDRVEELWKQF